MCSSKGKGGINWLYEHRRDDGHVTAHTICLSVLLTTSALYSQLRDAQLVSQK